MDTFECIRKRRSIREYKDIDIPREVLINVIDAARYAPSAGNLQPWKFIIITDEEKRRKIADICSQQFWMEQAPVHLILCCAVEKPSVHYGPRGEMLYSIQDCAMAAQNVMLAAYEVGLGSCFVASFVEDDLRAIADISERIRPQAVITLGYPAEEPEMPKRGDLNGMVFFDFYGNYKRDLDLYLLDLSSYFTKLVQRNFKAAKKAAHRNPHVQKIKDRLQEAVGRIKKK